MEPITTYRIRRSSSYGRLVSIILTVLAVFSPLYIDRRRESDLELEEQPINFAFLLPLLLLVLILAITLSLCFDQSFSRFDPYWIHRVGGSSGGIIIILIILALVLKCKASTNYWDAWLKFEKEDDTVAYQDTFGVTSFHFKRFRVGDRFNCW